MKTTELSDGALKRSVDNEVVDDAQPAPPQMTKTVAAAYKRAKKVSQARDIECAEQVAEDRVKCTENIAPATVKDGQSTLFDF